ncbi:MAG: CRISPR-associated endoribonuclease Cas2 [Desulfonauticus sp. 38_4375]|jgi:CRISPR-associated protein Cas2|nr:MAG: CRISPR-associated endoribonuclease Cas2 [Desulfonauticus sp. 38_4375]
MLYVVSYDISCPKRLNRVFNALKDFGVPVQYSVFECDLSLSQVEEMLERVSAILDLEEDSLLLYPVCKVCRQKTKISGIGEVWIDKEFWVY